MSEHHETEFWLEKYWPTAVILFGVAFVSLIVSFSPTL